MAIRSPLQDVYLITSTDGAGALMNAITDTGIWTTGNIGWAANVFNMFPINKPDLLSNMRISDVRKATGISQRFTGTAGTEYNVTVAEPSISGVEMELIPSHMTLLLWLLFQTGSSQAGASPYTYTNIPYSDFSCEQYCSIGRLLDAGAHSHQMDGCIITSMTISGEEGGILTVSCDFIGESLNTDADLAAVPQTASNLAPVLFQDISSVTLGGSAIDLISFSITITNNATRRFYDSAAAERYSLGALDVSGTITIPWDQTNFSKNLASDAFIAGSDNLLVISSGSGATQFDITANIRQNAEPTLPSDGNDHTITIPFVGAADSSSNSPASLTNKAISIVAGSSVTRGIPA